MEKNQKNIIKGRINRKSGNDFERRVRKDLEEQGWIVTKWQNNVDLEDLKLIPAKHQFNFFTKAMTVGHGFPDFLAIKKFDEEENFYNTGAVPSGKGLFINAFEVKFVESKSNGYLKKDEKAKCEWITKNLKIPIYIANKKKEGRKIKVEYQEYVTSM
jgi:hypothetical protein